MPIPTSAQDRRAARTATAFCLSLAAAAALTACGGSSSSGTAVLPFVPAPPAAGPVALTCDESLKTAFKPDANTTVRLVKQFRKGDDLNLDGKATGNIAASDICMVKLNVGPGHAGPADAPSTSSGIGIEVWLPAKAAWTQRVRVLGGGGFAGEPSISALDRIGASGGVDSPSRVAGVEGSVSAITDTGHASKGAVAALDGSFAMNPDGTVDTTLWADFASRGIHEMAVKAKALAAGFYGEAPKYSYWDGCSTGGRQGHMQAQVNPDDFDGILAGNSAINWTTFITSELYPQVVMQRDLGGTPLTMDQMTLVSSAAVSACDSTLTGQHDGFISDPAACKYDPAQDTSVLCTGSGGTNATAACLSTAQAQAVNKIWYGQTRDGSAPAPASDIGYGATLASNQLWYGLTRGTTLAALAGSAGGVPQPFDIAAHQVALNLQDPTLATPSFINATGNGANKWMGLSYAQLANASDRGKALQSAFSNINADNPDLARFRDRGAKLLTYHGLADPLIANSGTANYYERAAKAMGGIDALQKFYRYVEIPAMGHCAGVGSVNGITGTSPAANPPLPAQNQLYTALTDWVEKGVVPDSLVLQNADKSLARPLCTYPKKIAYLGGDVKAAANYACR